MRHIVFVLICATVALLANASMPSCIVMAMAGYLFYVCVYFFG